MPDLEKIEAELRAGLEGVTPGPWYQTGAPWFRSGDGVLAGSPDGNIAYLIADCDNFAVPREEYDGPFPLGDQDADAAHIARCDPDTIRLLLDELSRLREAEKRLTDERDMWKGRAEAAVMIGRALHGRAALSEEKGR
ncbi:hypothetical protein EN788_22350 [Mesorhizobium sp. M2D.F.Ca.ET.145.01.1.1]|uniref:hypothetical protein n=1 Tax=unclassified Mesorhizobium TaxID=325217 RepID=UPI000FCAEEA6|nr:MULTISPECIES: hypothetical protein [unclassified Mesorhizobium]TGU44659.1 hypothetical protein EN789_21900 [bacterium M00.F.Ca.ET.146.01.1.1]TGU58487.1 hypothetical protein EN791_021900 [Mesorhizobium sp. M2D.F.Ca.ET.148.01.1.1]TGU64419.1 hypothetical protein EN790_21895 [Mesorhizobium sp. M2D.F.Ca.ET.147.01.1.1]TGW09995.1 hypothetical protein EN788_22350 [Mesorhizobium sp. M2D.F.Ca.ET.145.01.1.1]